MTITDVNISVELAQGDTYSRAVLGHIRQIIHASDMHSKQNQRLTGLTTAQAVIMRAIGEMGEVSTRMLAGAASLSQATVTTILDRLEAKGFVERYRSVSDRRVVHARLTNAGDALLSHMPPLLDERFVKRFSRLSPDRRNEISCALEDVARMMSADATDAAAAPNGRR